MSVALNFFFNLEEENKVLYLLTLSYLIQCRCSLILFTKLYKPFVALNDKVGSESILLFFFFINVR